MDRFTGRAGKIAYRSIAIAVLVLGGIRLAGCGGDDGANRGGGGGGGGGAAGGGGGGTPPACGLPANANITASVAASRISGVAPLAVFFDATGTTAVTTTRPFHDLTFVWDFGDAGSGNWAKGSRAGASSRNVATGPVAAHVFETPGTYIVCATVTDGTNAVAQATTITVDDPNVVFAGTNTVCFSNASTFTGCPAGATQVSTSTDFVAVVDTATSGMRLLLERGGTWTAASIATLKPAAAGAGLIGAYGSGAAPKINMTGNATALIVGNSSVSVADWRVMDLEFDLQGGTLARGVSVGNVVLSQLLFLRLNIHDGHSGIVFSSSVVPGWDQIFIVDNSITTMIGGAGGYGIFLSAIRFGALGNFVDDTSQAEHATRYQYLSKAVISNNTVSRPGRSAANGGVGDKACMKLHSADFAATSAFTEMVVVSDNRFASDGGDLIIEAMPQSSGADERLRNIIFERNWFEPLAGFTSAFIKISGADITFRNNVGDLTPSPTTSISPVVEVDRRGVEPNPVRVNIYNNSFFSNLTGTHRLIQFGGTFLSATQSEAKNNLGYAPNAGVASLMVNDGCACNTVASNTSDTDLRLTVPAWASPASTPKAPSNFVLTGPSYLAGDATVAVREDFFLNARPKTGSVDIGASEF